MRLRSPSSTQRHQASARRRAVEHLDGTGLSVRHGTVDRLLLSASLELHGFVLLHATAAEVGLTWQRESPLLRRYAAFLFISAGTITSESVGPVYADEESGLLFILPSDEPVAIDIAGATEALVYAFDISEVAPSLLPPSPETSLLSSQMLLRSTYAFLQAVLFDPSPISPSDVPALRRMLLETARTLVDVTTGQSYERSILTRAQRIIENESASPSLSAGHIADRLNLSRRTLFRVFARQEKSIAGEIRRSRVARAISLLSNDPTMPADLLASGSGFGSVTSLQRALRETGHGTVRRLRADLSAPRQTPPHHSAAHTES